MTYSEKLKHPKWQRKRLEILNRDNFKCQLCSDEETTLHVHHLTYSKDPWDTDNKDLVTLCEHCHDEVESFKKEKEDFKYTELELIKLSFDGGSYLYFIRYCDELILRYINNKTNGGFMLNYESIEKFNKLKNKARKYERDNKPIF